MAGGNVPSNLAPIFAAAGAQYNIPAPVLAGIASVESNFGANQGPSSAGAVGLMQFEPGTARGIGVNPYNARSAIFGAAKLLTQYGYHQNPTRAIGAYNGGPGNPQYGYARQVLSEASRVAGQLRAGGALPSSPAPSAPQQFGVSTSNTFDQAGFQNAQRAFQAAQFVKSAGNPFDLAKGANRMASGDGVLFSSGALPSTAPNPSDYVMAQSHLQALAGNTVLTAHPAVKQLTGHPSNLAGGFLPAGAKYIVGRRDQGRDGQTAPGGPILAPGAGYVVRVGSDPGGFGPRYPIVHFTTGPYAGRTIYLGHTLAAVTGGSFKPGAVLSYTGTTPIGNASVPGWFEIGFADSGSPGPMGQTTPF